MRSLAILLFLQGLPAPDSAVRTCWRGRPLPHCAAFVVTDFAYLRRLNGPPDGGVMAVTGELGAMVNAGPRTAWGATAVKSLGTERSYVGLRLRYRHWLNDETSLDLAPGVTLWGDHDQFALKSPSAT